MIPSWIRFPGAGPRIGHGLQQASRHLHVHGQVQGRERPQLAVVWRHRGARRQEPLHHGHTARGTGGVQGGGGAQDARQPHVGLEQKQSRHIV